ncbi:hypothetical protein HDV02_000626, partial [Globomyces sp. JEL0801]
MIFSLVVLFYSTFGSINNQLLESCNRKLQQCPKLLPHDCEARVCPSLVRQCLQFDSLQTNVKQICAKHIQQVTSCTEMIDKCTKSKDCNDICQNHFKKCFELTQLRGNMVQLCPNKHIAPEKKIGVHGCNVVAEKCSKSKD